MLTARQLAAALAEIDNLIDGVTETLARFEGFASNRAIDDTAIPEAMSDAWNHLHDAQRALQEHRAQVEMNPRPIPASEQGTWNLVQLNID